MLQATEILKVTAVQPLIDCMLGKYRGGYVMSNIDLGNLINLGDLNLGDLTPEIDPDLDLRDTSHRFYRFHRRRFS